MPSLHPIAIDDPGRIELLMGNEAIARGALESGVRVAAAYPGNPSSEIIEALSRAADPSRLHVQWSVNEKVALEVAAGASFFGLRALAAMKQNGLNVAYDFLTNLNLCGVKGGLVVVVCDDPGGISSSNEQDTRFMARLTDIPLLEVAGFEDARDIVRYAFDLSEEIGSVVMVRSVTRISHGRGPVTFDLLPELSRKPRFDPKGSFTPFPILVKHEKRHEALLDLEDTFSRSSFNTYTGPDNPELVVVTSGIGVLFSEEAVELLGQQNRVGIAHLGTTWPLPKAWLREIIEKTDRFLVVEEVDPFIENNLKEFLGENTGRFGAKTVFGKSSGHMPSVGGLTPEHPLNALKALFEIPFEPRPADYSRLVEEKTTGLIIDRALGFCPGCPHRASFWVIKNALAKDGREGIVTGDIGCYAMSMWPSGYQVSKTLQAMGSGVGVASGMGILDVMGKTQPVIAVCGDSTFFHAAIPALINTRFNTSPFVTIILDNSATAMTGFQPHPGTGTTCMGQEVDPIEVTRICESIGFDVRTLDPFDLGTTETAILTALRSETPQVLIFKRTCALIAFKEAGKRYAMTVDSEKCIGETCGCDRYCTRVFKCPGLIWNPDTKKAEIDEAICTGCGVCADICPEKAISREAIA
jgi:indolepyruvate ferredoxin oxidoreductase alpha subunit